MKIGGCFVLGEVHPTVNNVSPGQQTREDKWGKSSRKTEDDDDQSEEEEEDPDEHLAECV